MTIILTANMQPAYHRRGGYRAYIEYLLQQRWAGTAPRPDWNQTAGEPLPAVIIASQWAVKCDVCREIIAAEPGEPFYCPACQNQANSFRPRPVTWPAERREIERLLLLRPDPGTRNLPVGSTLVDVRLDNVVHGLEG